MDVYLILLQWRCCAEGLWMHMPSVQTAKSDLVSPVVNGELTDARPPPTLVL